jgi:hypothetical protein
MTVRKAERIIDAFDASVVASVTDCKGATSDYTTWALSWRLNDGILEMITGPSLPLKKF